MQKQCFVLRWRSNHFLNHSPPLEVEMETYTQMTKVDRPKEKNYECNILTNDVPMPTHICNYSQFLISITILN